MFSPSTRLAFVFRCLLVLIAASGTALAADNSTAELLFQKGRARMVAQDFDAACQLFTESLALDPAAGTVMNLAACEEKRGHLTASWDHWKDALEQLEDDDPRRSFAEEQLNLVDQKLARLEIIVSSDAPKGLVVEQNELALKKSELGELRRVNPGVQRVVVKAKGYQDNTYQFSLDPGQRKKLVVTAGPQTPDESKFGSATPGERLRRGLGFGALGLGGVAVGGIIVTGVLLPAQKKKVEEHCVGTSCSKEGAQAASTGRTLLALNTASWIVAGVSLAAGGVLLFTLPRSERGSKATSQDDQDLPKKGKVQASDQRSFGVALVGTHLKIFGEF